LSESEFRQDGTAQPTTVPLLPVPVATAIPAATFQAVALAGIMAAGFLIRLFAAVRLTPHLDEASSILAAQATASHGWPLLPSGTVYFQGATLSWLLAPLTWLGLGEIDNLALLRLPTVLAGTLTLYLCYRLALAVTGDATTGLVMAALVALDQLSVQWSSMVRMYGLLQAVTVGLAWAFVTLLTGERSIRRALLVAALCWVAVFTHVGASLLLPAMALAAALVHGRRAWARLDLVLALGLGALAPVALLTLNQVLGTASIESTAPSSQPWTFVGDNLLQPLAGILHGPLRDPWETFGRTKFLPGLIVAAATLVTAWWLFRARSRVDTQSTPLPPPLWLSPVPGERTLAQGRLRSTPAAMLALLCLYWVPVLAVGLFTVSPKARYLLHVQALGYLFVAWLVVEAARRGAGKSLLLRLAPAASVVLVLGLALLGRFESPVIHPNYHEAMAYVATHQEPGELVVVARPAIGYLALDEARRDDLVYLAGGEDQPGTRRYTRLAPDGDLVDYWVGVHAIVTTGELRRLLEANPGAWVVLDEGHLTAELAYGGEVEQVLTQMTVVEYRAQGGALVLRVR
jgi:hypothetical protein